MKFTKENQKGNRISRTTIQRVKHFIYSNNEVSISGIDGRHSVWHKQGHRTRQKINDLTLSEAVDFANNFINNI